MYSVSAPGEYFTCTLPPSSSAPAFGPHVRGPLRSGCPWMPCLVRVTSANSQLSQSLKRLYLPFRPFFTLQWALGSSQVWLQPLNSFTPTHIVARHRQVPHSELPPRSQKPRSLLSEALSSPFPTKSALTLTVLLQATGPVLLGVRRPASVWYPTLPCALFTRLPSPGLAPCSTP